MLPKVIHYCWFGGGAKNELILRCIASWRKYCPDYEIIEWNETNYDVNKHSFMRDAWKAKKWAFVSDYARIDILYHHGGVYLDTDVELIKNLDPFLEYRFFAGFESESFVAFGLGFGSEAGHPVLKDILDTYDGLIFDNSSLHQSIASCPKIQTQALKKHGLICNNRKQVFEDIHIFPSDYFCPMSYHTGKTSITENTVSIHHYDMSWTSDRNKKEKKLEWKLIGKLGERRGKLIISVISFPGKLYIHTKEGNLADYIRLLFRKSQES